ncbi:hypothetical protein GCM10025869_26610 [Homoserinibacter gongjuensis]|uniref:Uncharacterized protein n=1 Tax=Homoserinibacter gongjuensis TaxID=1162968 RepID=A0ABQ6JZM2_9MICO|nr:hypothetical protein GCM10025869_26610 [Homoserinibacter gongjuensis]
MLGNEAREGAGSEGGLPTGARDEHLVGEGQPPERHGVRQGLNLVRTAESGIRVHHGEGAQLPVETLDAGEVVLGELTRCHLAPPQPVELFDGGQVVQLEHDSSVRA